jgi:site-specific recombinase XerD
MPADRVFELARWPALATNEHMATWFRIQVNLGLAPRTLTAYARGLADFVGTCVELRVDPMTADRTAVAEWVHRLSEQRGRHGDDVVAIDSGWGLANATIQQRLTSVRLFYDFLIEERVRDDNPVGRGRYTPRRAFGRGVRRGLVPRFRRLPWIPTEEQWLCLLEAAAQESIRNRLMLALAYDAGLRREELCLLATGDVDPARRTLTVRAETTKTRASRVVPYSVPTGQLLVAYLAHRRELSAQRGPLFLSESRRNTTQPITAWTWSKVVRRIALRANVPQFSSHTLRHLCLTDLARSGWDVHAIARFAGHRSLDTTAQYIQLSARDLAGMLQGAMSAIHAWRIAMVDQQLGAGGDR